jgi:hypothetical protein
MAIPTRAARAAGMTDLAELVSTSFGARIGRSYPAEGWFGPGTPLAPQAQAAAVGRQFDYPVGYNIQVRPRAGEPIDFPTLRALAQFEDITRACIETRKDQLSKLPWVIQERIGNEEDATSKRLMTFFERPDREHDYLTWQRPLLDDLLVIDAPCVYVRPTLGGKAYALEVIDGGSIKRVLDDRGRTPAPPLPAYQQILKGMPAVDYTTEELIYRPRNFRSDRIYGFSPVEQLLPIINLAIRRQVWQLDYYSEGNIPDMLAAVPSGWTTKQIEDFQKYWDVLMAGELAARRRVKFVPGDLKTTQTRQEKLFDDYDEWIARKICFGFSLPPQAFVKQMNRATAETAQETALEEGLQPYKVWWKTFMDSLIQGPLGEPGYEYEWQDEQSVSALEQAQIDHIYVSDGTRKRSEIRDDHGWGPDAELDALPLPGAKAQQPEPDEQQVAA